MADNSISYIDRLSKMAATCKKQQEFKWVLDRVIKNHGHTITLLEAALIASAQPELYDYGAHCKQVEEQQEKEAQYALYEDSR